MSTKDQERGGNLEGLGRERGAVPADSLQQETWRCPSLTVGVEYLLVRLLVGILVIAIRLCAAFLIGPSFHHRRGRGGALDSRSLSSRTRHMTHDNRISAAMQSIIGGTITNASTVAAR